MIWSWARQATITPDDRKVTSLKVRAGANTPGRADTARPISS